MPPSPPPVALAPLHLRHRVYVDCETTGLDPAVDEVIAIAIVREDPATRTVLEEWTTRILPTRPELLDAAQLADLGSSGTARAVNGYSEAQWAGSPRFAAVADEIVRRLEGAVWVGQNPTFDRDFIRAELRRAGISVTLTRTLIDLATLSYVHLAPLGLESLRMDAVREWCGMPPRRPHTALGDALDTRHLYHYINDHAAERARVSGAARNPPGSAKAPNNKKNRTGGVE